jgi:VCBS repeat protein/HYDIN/CFA65/VesB family protein/centrosomal CEP192-like protein
VTPRDSSNVVSVLLGNGNGTFGPAMTFAVGSAPLGVVAGDFNGDGRLDLAVADNGGSSVSVLLQSTAYLAKASLQFAAQVLNTNSTAQSVTLTNLGPTALSISSIVVAGTNEADFSQNNTCGSSVAPGASCKISVDFHPTAVGLRTALIVITDSAVDSPQKITLNGTGVISGPDATLSATSLTFATQLLGTISAAKAVILTNYGTASLSISSIAASGDFNAANVCGLSLAPLANCTISTTFSPTQIGSRTGALSILDDAPGSPQTVKLKGTATEVDLNPSSLSFVVHRGNVGSQTITLTNVGGTALSITSMTISGGPFSQTNTCGSGVAAGGSCSITVSFFAPLQTGQYTGDLLIYDDGGASPQSIPLKGTSFCRWYFGHCY